MTYSKETKASFLGIDPALLERVGVVSEECAKEMAEAVLRLADTDYALSFTGVAGPDDLEGKPKGTVYIGLAQKNGETLVAENHFSRDRSYVRHSSVMKGLDMLRRVILNKN